MINITNELSQFERGLLFYNCGEGICVDREGNESWFKRNFASNKIESDGKVFFRTGEIFENSDSNSPVIVYREIPFGLEEGLTLNVRPNKYK